MNNPANPSRISNPAMADGERLLQCVAEVARAFGLGTPSDIRALGGTATPKFAVQVPEGRFVARLRPAEFADEKLIRFDHEALRRLAEHGLPVPRPLRRADGTSWFHTDQGVFEVLSWIEGEPFRQGDRAAITALGEVLARFHAVFRDDIPAGKEGVLREDHPDLLAVYVEQLRALCWTAEDSAQVEGLVRQLDLVRRQLDQALYPKLPRAVIHGDIHPGNVGFKGASVTALYDFDYLSPQARCRDLVDALMFFASDRRQSINADDIRSLTQPFVPNLQWALWLLGGYQQVSRLTDLEWVAFPLLMRSQWLQIRLRGSRKVHPDEKLAFVMDGFSEVISWLDHEAGNFFAALRRR
jgi:Ser/Thr protein kinase RdoA (MazF antagonist)